MVESPLPSMSLEDMQILIQSTESLVEVGGDAAEAGVYNGGSAWLIWKAIQHSGKELYLLDSFKGLAPRDEDYPLYGIHPSWYAGNESLVRELFLPYPKVHVMSGDCVESLKLLEGKTFSFVHLDLDLYLPTKTCLEFFLKRLEPGSKILVHDIGGMTGVKRAVDEVGIPFRREWNYAILEVK